MRVSDRTVMLFSLLLVMLFFLIAAQEPQQEYVPPPIPDHLIVHCRTDTVLVPRYWRDQTGRIVHKDEVIIEPCPEKREVLPHS